MSEGALIVGYHAVEAGPQPLCIEPARLRDHLDCLADAGARTLTISQLASALRTGIIPERSVALTFDDGAESAVRVAAPLLAERGLQATFYFVAGHLGGFNDWPTEPRRAPRLRLADEGALRELAAAGFEIGSHGMTHLPLARISGEPLRREVVEAQEVLEGLVQMPVDSFSFPHGVAPGEPARKLVAATYAAACVGGNTRARPDADPYALPRVDAHYLRAVPLLRRAVEGGDLYLAARRLGARARRVLLADYGARTRARRPSAAS